MRTYEVVCEGLASRLVIVESDNQVDAWRAAQAEFASLTGAERDAVAVVDIRESRPDAPPCLQPIFKDGSDA